MLRVGIKTGRITILAALGLLSTTLLAEAPETDRLIQQIESRYNGAKTLSVQFVEDFDVLGRRRPSEAGTLTLRKQGKMRWDYARPEGKLFISDGRTIYLYTSRDNRVEKIPVKDTEDLRAPLAFLLGHLDLKKEFRSFRIRQADGGRWLDATAKNDRIAYAQVRMLVVGKGEIKQLEISGRDGSSMTFAFANEKLNPALDDKMFSFTIPPGAQVVDAVEFGGEGK